MAIATIGRWGRSLAVRLPPDVAGRLRLEEGIPVEVEQRADEIVIRRASLPLTLDALFDGKSPAEWRAIYAGSYEWGPDRGREIVED